MISPEERESIIAEAVDRAVEKAMLRMPEEVGNLIVENAKLLELNRDFYNKHPEFKQHKRSVASVVEKISAAEPSRKIEDILADHKTATQIRDRINTVKGLDTENVTSTPNRSFRASRPSGDHGEL